MYFIIVYSFFFFDVRAKVMFISWRDQARTRVWIELNGLYTSVLYGITLTSIFASFNVSSNLV